MLDNHYREFIAAVPLKLPGLLDMHKLEQPQFYDDYVLLEFAPEPSYTLPEVMDMFEDEMEMIILYHHIPGAETRFGESCCCYSNPHFEQMYKMNAFTDVDGMVNRIKVTIYDSLEHLLADLRLDLKLHGASGAFKYKQKETDVLFNFF